MQQLNVCRDFRLREHEELSAKRQAVTSRANRRRLVSSGYLVLAHRRRHQCKWEGETGWDGFVLSVDFPVKRCFMGSKESNTVVDFSDSRSDVQDESASSGDGSRCNPRAIAFCIAYCPSSLQHIMKSILYDALSSE